MSRSRRIGTALLMLASVALGGWLVISWPWLTREPVGPPRSGLPQAVEGEREPVSGHFVGHTESSIVERFGPPSDRRDGHYAAPPVGYRLRYPDAITATYVRPSGVLYLSFCKERGQLVCFSSDWLPQGVAF